MEIKLAIEKICHKNIIKNITTNEKVDISPIILLIFNFSKRNIIKFNTCIYDTTS